jgi:hypothetical protein
MHSNRSVLFVLDERMTSHDLHLLLKLIHLLGAALLFGTGATITGFCGHVKVQGLNNTACMIRPGMTVNNPAITSAPKKMAIIALR